MFTERVNKWECDCVVRAANMVESYIKRGCKSWRVNTIVYWIETSTD